MEGVVEGAVQGMAGGIAREFAWTGLVTLAALFVYFWSALMVGRGRGLYKVPAPSMDGPPEFLRAVRVQINTLEQIVLFLPALWLFAAAWGDMAAALVGVFWPVGRILYALAYYRDAKKRGPGFLIAMLPTLLLLLGALAGFVRVLL
ncbi:MAPEG family protein [Rhodocista pekingensis]|uniref:MAPEG family protein n=1 Tax=Rhodocista pekingensis TaxID=201185 RepID=A0ABW2KXU6_9PROT